MKIKEVSIYMPNGDRITFIKGEKIMVNGQPTNQSVTEIKTSLFKKAVYLILSDGETIKYNNFPYILTV